ncbi:MAG: hypothetical protein QF619_10810, partial [Candidatus Binatia bacterium]|nr:hypothetical protein [Candidatus Binatia bacterium]
FDPIVLPNMPGVGLTGISLCNSDGDLFFFFHLGGIGAPDFSGTIDIGTGVFDQLPDGLIDDGKGNGLAFLADNTLLHARTPFTLLADGELRELDAATGGQLGARELMFLFEPMENNQRVNAMDLDPDTGTLFVSFNNKPVGGQSENYLATIDLSDEMVVLVDLVGNPTVAGLDAIAFAPVAGGAVLDHFQCDKVKARCRPLFKEVRRVIDVPCYASAENKGSMEVKEEKVVKEEKEKKKSPEKFSLKMVNAPAIAQAQKIDKAEETPEVAEGTSASSGSPASG